MDLVHQERLSSAIHHLFKGENILHNVRKQAKILNPFTGAYLELDIWIPRLQLCFEFQDIYHYGTSWYSQLPLSYVQQKDNTKQQIVQHKKITLVMVPFWWDGSSKSLQQTIFFQRPDLFPYPLSAGSPIPLLPPLEQYENEGIPYIGEPMLASFPAILPDYTSWWMGEKYDGVRFCSLENKKLYTRNGADIILLKSMQHLFPSAFLDGELWLGRGCFTDAQKLLFTSPWMYEWPNVRILCFDNATPHLNFEHFENRYESIFRLIPHDHPFLMAVTRVKCSGNVQLREMLQEIIDYGGEGLILRAPKSVYEHGRSNLLVKLKAYRGDKEALLVDVENNTAILQLPNGSIFEVHEPTSATQLYSGDIVTFSYDNYTQGSLPIKPKILRVREDLTWQDVLRDFESELVHSLDLNTTSKRVVGQASKFPEEEPRVKEDTIKRRIFFENLAKKRGFDPLVATNWYSQVLRYEDEWTMLRPYRGRFPKALLHLFPEIGLVEQKFLYNTFPENGNTATSPGTLSSKKSKSQAIKVSKPEIPPPTKHVHLYRRGYWDTHERANIRRFFDKFALDRQLDPLLASTWYHMNLGHISRAGGPSSRTSSGRSIYSSIISAYPEIGKIASIIQQGNTKSYSDKYLLYLCAQYEKQYPNANS